MAWNPAEIDYVTLIGNIVITVQYIKDVWMFNIHNMKKCKQESESENIVKCVYLDIFIYSKASSIRKFRRNYVPFWVLLRKRGMKGVCLRKRWGKCYRRCIVKFNFLAFFEWISNFYYVYLWVSIWNITFKEKYSKLRHNLSIPCHFKVGLILK